MNCFGRVDMNERNVEMAAKQVDHFVRLALAQQPVIDEHAGELVADRLVDQHCRDRGIDAARQAADHPRLADLRANAGDLLVAERAIVQSPLRPATLNRKLARSFAPSGVWTTSGWNIVV